MSRARSTFALRYHSLIVVYPNDHKDCAFVFRGSANRHDIASGCMCTILVLSCSGDCFNEHLFFFSSEERCGVDKCLYRERDKVCMIVQRGAIIEVGGADKSIKISVVS